MFFSYSIQDLSVIILLVQDICRIQYQYNILKVFSFALLILSLVQFPIHKLQCSIQSIIWNVFFTVWYSLNANRLIFIKGFFIWAIHFLYLPYDNMRLSKYLNSFTWVSCRPAKCCHSGPALWHFINLVLVFFYVYLTYFPQKIIWVLYN